MRLRPKRKVREALEVFRPNTVARAARKTGDVLDEVPPVSPNPMTNLVLTDIVLRSGGQLMRHAVERTLLGTKYSKQAARDIVKGRSFTQTLVGTAIARLATRSVPGAIVVGGAMLAKTLYDRSHDRAAEQAEGAAEVAEQAKKA